MTDMLHVVCPHCDAVNRVPADRVDAGGSCGRCKRALFPGEPLELDPARFELHLTRNDLPVVVDFWAPWCAPCRMMAPAFASVAKRLEARARFVKVDTERHPELGARFGIRSIPTLAILKNGRELARQSGAMDAGRLQGWIESSL